ncbi:MAG TPA: cytochrome C [Vicinamibacteria bacterium]|nr:cytochrome C [Vicinamibacteria bacterium]
MMRPATDRALLLGSALLLLASPAAHAQQCFDCHAQPGSSVAFKGGDSLDVTIDKAAWQASVHGKGGLSCTDCHGDIKDYPHPESGDRSPRDLTLRLYTSCQQCHEEQFKKTLDSVHQRALAAGHKGAAVCSDCHDPHRQQKITDDQGKLLPAARLHIPETCARCHAAIYDQYRHSVHGAALVTGNPDVPTCIDCHGVHNISDPTTARFRLASPRMCADCHTDRRRMARYHLSTQVLRTYVADFHGSTVTLFQRTHPDQATNKPVCYDCHGIHDIASKNDPGKGLQVKANLLRTCRKCHPDAGTSFPDAWLSHYIPSPERTPAVYWAQAAYNVLIPGVVGGMVLFVGTDFVRRRLERRAHKDRRHHEPNPIDHA